jgi:hypothetical protein
MPRKLLPSKVPMTLDELLKIPGRMTRRKLKTLQTSQANSEKAESQKQRKRVTKKKKAAVKKSKKKTKKVPKKVKTRVCRKDSEKSKSKEKKSKTVSRKSQSGSRANVRVKKRKEIKKRCSKNEKSKKIKKKIIKPKRKPKKKVKIKFTMNTQSILNKILQTGNDISIVSNENRSISKKAPSPEDPMQIRNRRSIHQPNEILEKPSVPKLFPGVDKIGKRSMATETLRNFTAEETLTHNHSLWKNLGPMSLADSIKNSNFMGNDINMGGFQFKSAQSHKRLLLGKNGFTLPELFEEVCEKFRILDFLLWKFHELKREPTLLEINSLIAGYDRNLTFTIEDIKNIICVFSEFCTIRAIFFGNPISNLEGPMESVKKEKKSKDQNNKYMLNDRPITLFAEGDLNIDKQKPKSTNKNLKRKAKVQKKEIIKLEDLMEVQQVADNKDSLKISGKFTPKSTDLRRKKEKEESLLRIGDDGFIMDYIISPMVYSSKADLEIRDQIFFKRLADFAKNVHDKFLNNQGNVFVYQNQQSWHFEFDSDLIWKELIIQKHQKFENLEKSRQFFTFNVDDVTKRIGQNEQIKKEFVERLINQNKCPWLDSFSNALFDQIFDIIPEKEELELICEEEYEENREDHDDFLLEMESVKDTPCKLDEINQVNMDKDLWMQNPALPVVNHFEPREQLDLVPRPPDHIHSQQICYPDTTTPMKNNEFDSFQNLFANSDYKNTISRKSKSSRKEKRVKEKSYSGRDDADLDFLKTEKKSVSVKWSVSKKSEKHSFLISPLVNMNNRPKLKKKFPKSKKQKCKLSSNVKGVLSKIISKNKSPWKFNKLKNLNLQNTPKTLQKSEFDRGMDLLQIKTVKRKLSTKDITNFQENKSKNTFSVTKKLERPKPFNLSGDKRGVSGADFESTEHGILRGGTLGRQQEEAYYEKSVTMSCISLSKILVEAPKRKSNQLHLNSMKEEIKLYFQKRGFKTVFLSNLFNYLKGVFKNSCRKRLQKLLEEFFNKNFQDFKTVDISDEQKLIKPVIPQELM